MSLNPHDILAQVEQVADAVDRHFDSVFSSLKSSFENSQWIPEAVRPVHKAIPKPPVRLSYLQRAERWVDHNRAVTAAIVAFLGTATFIVWQGRLKNKKRRRARRGAHGAKVEAVVLAGPPESPLTRSLAHDLEKRGFLVYIPIESAADEQLIRAEGRDDIRPLHLDLSSPATISHSLTAFTDALSTVTRSQTVHFASLVIVPALDTHPTLPLSALSSNFWTGNLYVHLQRPIDLIHAFLPLLQAQSSIQNRPSTSGSSPQKERLPTSSIVVLSRGITATLPLANRGTESVTHAALSAYLRTLRTEAPALSVSHVQLGAVDLGPSAETRHQLVLHPRSRSNSPTHAQLPVLGRLGKADMAPARQLHHAIFDAITGHSSGTAFVGRGARTYAFVGKYTPVEIIRWMTGGGSSIGTSAQTQEVPRGMTTRQSSEEWEELNRSSESIGRPE